MAQVLPIAVQVGGVSFYWKFEGGGGIRGGGGGGGGTGAGSMSAEGGGAIFFLFGAEMLTKKTRLPTAV